MKIFATSDIHGFYNEFKDALNRAGFEENNPNHLLIVCGDYWDKGHKPWQVMKYLLSLKNCILIKGNHEVLMEKMFERGFTKYHDYHNGTAETASILIDKYCEENKSIVNRNYFDTIKPLVKSFYDKMVNYYETKNYIFVHSWIPYFQIPKMSGAVKSYNPNWRIAAKYHWEKEAMWENPFKMAKDRLNQTGKTIVHGHWHNSAYWAEKEGLPEFNKELSKFDICEHDGCVGLDACTAFSRKVNIFVTEDDLIKS